MRPDVLSKRLFLAGCFGLPWLWCVHVLYWYSKTRAKARGDATAAAEQGGINSEGLLSADSEEYLDDPADPEEISLEEKKWIRRSFVGAVLASMAWVTWIIVFEIMKDSMNPNWFVSAPDEAEFTGW